MKTLGQTTYFTFKYDETIPGADNLATAICTVADAEFDALAQWFNIHAGFGASNRVTVTVNLKLNADGTGAGADNQGYDGGGDTLIRVLAQGYSGKTPAQAAEVAKSSFVAELVEVMMSYNRQHAHAKGWDPAASDGEALSLWCAMTRFPSPYFQSGSLIADKWFGLPNRADYSNNWIDRNQPSAGLAPGNAAETTLFPQTYGCVFLFINYLKDQLGFGIDEIIQKGGSTPAETYLNLTGSNDGFVAFTTLLECFYPAAQMLGPLSTGDPFPLLHASEAVVSMAATREKGTPTLIASGTADRVICGVRHAYHFDMNATGNWLTCTAHQKGFAHPLCEWSVNGTVVGNGTVNLTVTVPVVMENPSLPGTMTTTMRAVHLEGGPWSNLNSLVPIPSTLTLRVAYVDPFITPDVEAWVDLVVTLRISDKFCSPGDAAVVTASPSIQLQEAVFEKQYWIDFAECMARIRKLIDSLQVVASPFDKLDWSIASILTLPDPPPPDLARTVRELSRFSALVQELERSGPQGLGRQLGDLAAARLGLSQAAQAGLAPPRG